MLYMTLILFLLLTGLIVFQRATILKYKSLRNSEKSFVASLTHDLKSPTSAQINMLNLLMKGKFGKLNPEQYEMIKLTCSSSKYISNLIGMVLAGYKFDKNYVPLNKTIFDISKLIDNILIQNKYLINDKELKIIFKPVHKQYLIYADALQIERVILNLLSNAITYSIKNTEIYIQLKQNSKYIKFTITNKSNPISAKEIKQIFNKFSSSQNSKFNKSTTGLGLYTAKNIIDRHKGTIFVKSTPDGIFTFGFKLKKITQQKCTNTKTQSLFHS